MTIVRDIAYFPFGDAQGWIEGSNAGHPQYTRQYDSDGRVSSHRDGSVNRALAYDAASRVTSQLDSGIGGSADWSFGYDDQDRLISANMAASVAFDPSWIAQGRVGATYLAILTATLGSGSSASSVTLAQDSFQLIAQTAAGIQATGGTPQAITVTQVYPVALEATVLDTVNQPLANVLVTFVAPTNGASVGFPNGATASTDTNGRAHVQVTANATSGAVSVSATAPGVTNTAFFSLQNLSPTAANISASGGTPQTAPAGSVYPSPLQALVQDNLGQPMAGIAVTFSAPASGASVSFPAGTVAITDANGHAQVNVQANATAGDFSVSASAPNVSGSAAFALSISALPSADVGITLSGPSSVPAPITPTGTVTLQYTIDLNNSGSADAQDVQLTATPPPGVTFSSSDGACVAFPCALGTLAAGQSLSMTANYSMSGSDPARSVTMAMIVSSSTPDPNPANNQATVTTQVIRASTAIVPVPLDWRALVVLLGGLLALGVAALRRRVAHASRDWHQQSDVVRLTDKNRV